VAIVCPFYAHCLSCVSKYTYCYVIAGLDWKALHTFRAPHIPKGSSKMKRMLEELQYTPSDSPRYPDLIKAITANFDEFQESNSQNAFSKGASGGGGKQSGAKHGHSNHAAPAGGEGAASKQEADAAFLNYTYKRKTVSQVGCERVFTTSRLGVAAR
jgi:hypothetical protein